MNITTNHAKSLKTCGKINKILHYCSLVTQFIHQLENFIECVKEYLPCSMVNQTYGNSHNIKSKKYKSFLTLLTIT